MAIKPNDGEVFLREVDEELRKERMNNIVRRYGWAIIAGIVLVLAAIGGYFWWQARSEARAGEQGEALVNAMQSLEAGNRNAATPKIDELANSDVDGYRAAALFARANVQLGANNNAAAIATLRAIAGDEGLAEPYRHAALVRLTALEFDALQPQQVIQRLGPLARPGQAWFGSAGEMVGIAHLRMNRPDLAGPLFGQIGRDETVPPSIRTRAIQMAGALGIDALPQNETSRGQPDAAGNPPADGNQAATREKAQ